MQSSLDQELDFQRSREPWIGSSVTRGQPSVIRQISHLNSQNIADRIWILLDYDVNSTSNEPMTQVLNVTTTNFKADRVSLIPLLAEP